MNSEANINFFTPDDRWEIWKIHSQEEFLRRYLVKGKFHSLVPSDVKSEYEKVERIMAYSYFFYPLYDEAYSKLTRIFEMAVVLRCDQLKITFTQKLPTLNDRLKKLELGNPLKSPNSWKAIREIRNHFAHPKREGYTGPIVYNGIVRNINMINELFLTQEFIDQKDSDYNNLLMRSTHLRKELGVLHIKTKKYLIVDTLPYKSSTKNGIEYSIWCFYPVLKTFPKDLSSTNFADPIVLTLSGLSYTNDGLEAFDTENNERISFKLSNNLNDIETASNYWNQITLAEKEVIEMNQYNTANYLSKKIERFKYDFYWD